jgi:hypothetical protein
LETEQGLSSHVLGTIRDVVQVRGMTSLKPMKRGVYTTTCTKPKLNAYQIETKRHVPENKEHVFRNVYQIERERHQIQIERGTCFIKFKT